MCFQIKEIIRQGVEVPEGQNDLRRMQLRELALLNGTLRENDGPRCSNCGSSDHKSWMVIFLIHTLFNVFFLLNCVSLLGKWNENVLYLFVMRI